MPARIRGWGYAAIGVLAMVLAALYALRLISAILHERRGDAVPVEGPDLTWNEVGLLVPLVGLLVALSVWPAAVSGHSFPGDRPAQTIEAGRE